MSTILGRTGQTMDVRNDGAVPLFRAGEPETFSWTSATADIDGNDVVLLVSNDSDKKHLHITDMYVYTDVPTALDFFTPVYAAFAGGTAVTGVALNRTSVTVAPATAFADEQTSALANIFATLYSNETAGDQHGVLLKLDGLLILGYHDSCAINIVAASAVANSYIIGYFHDNH